MPAINKLRVANVNFKENTRRYDDLIIPVYGNNAIIDGENGDGKTLYTQCAFQTIVPNSYFHPANTISRLFEDNNNSVIHSMIEWELDKGNEYEFMITGFCAKDTQKDNEEVKKSFEYFNYVILYKHDFKFSVESIHLKTEKDGKTKRMGYKELKEHLRKLSDNEEKCFVKIFTSKKDYLSFLYNYGINEAEWRLLFNTNRQEGGAEHYFTTNFKQPKDLITKEIVPLIESIDRYRLGDEMSNEQLAKSLLDMNKTIKQLTEKTQRLNELNVVEASLNRIISFNEDLKRALEDKDATFIEVVKGYNKELLIIKEISDAINEIETAKKELEDESANIREIKEELREEMALKDKEKEKLELDLKEVDKIEKILDNRARKEGLLQEVISLESKKEVVLSELEKLEMSKNELDIKTQELKDLEIEKRAENIYLEYKDTKIVAQQKQLKLDNFSRSNSELLAKKKEAESMYLYALNKLKELLDTTISHLDMDLDGIDIDIKNNNEDILSSSTQLNELKLNISSKENEIKSFENEISKLSTKENNTNKDNDILLAEIKALVDNMKDEKNTATLKEHIAKLSNLVNLGNISALKEGVIVNTFNELEAISREILLRIEKLREDRLSLENDTLKSELENKIEKIQLDIKAKFDEEKELSKEIGELKSSIKSNDYKIEVIMKSLEEYKSSLLSLENIFNELKVDDRFECELELNAQVSRLKNESFNVTNKINELESKLADLNNNEGLSLSKELINNFNIVANTYSSAVLGRDFIKGLSVTEKDLYLSKTTLIPYSIVLNEQDYNLLLKNENIKEKMGDFLTPIINITAIKNLNRLDDTTVYFNTLSKEAFIDEDRILEEIKKVELELSKLEKEHHVVKERLQSKEKQLKEVSVVNAKYEPNFEEVKSQEVLSYKDNNTSIEKDIDYKNNLLVKIEEDRKNLDTNIATIKEQISKHELYLKEEISKINASIDSLQQDTLDNKSKLDILNKIENKADLFISNTRVLAECVEQIDILKSKIDSNNKLIEQFKLNIKEVELKIASLNSRRTELEEIKKFKENLQAENKLKLKETLSYKSDIPVGTIEKETELSVEELREQVKIFNRNYEKEHSQMEELENEIKSAHDKCLKKKNEIELLKVSFDKLDSKSNLLMYNDPAVFESISNRLKAVETETKSIIKSIKDTDKEKTRIETTIDNKLSDANKIDTHDDVIIEEDYSVEQKRNEINGLIDKVKSDKKELDKRFEEYSYKEYEYREQMEDLSNRLNKEQDKLRINKNHKDNTEALIALNNIDVSITDEVADSITFVVKEASKKIQWHNNRAEEIKLKHTREITYTSERLENSIFEFVSVLKDILPPNTIDEVVAQNNSISSSEGYLYYLNQERENLNKELEDLSLMKTEFINKCVYNVEYLIEKLKKLSKQSTVVLNDKKIRLIDLKLYELNSEQKIEKMTNYIDRLLEIIDEEDAEESIKILKNELTASKLLEQGVRNIKNCEVNIYIPDSVNIEEGYYEKWGGGASSGQRNIMYFTTVMALIVFIRESSSLNGATGNTKVLFGDGPFRGAAALYLWEPVFKMMQENNIQFLVTNYATAPHLTNLFSSRAMLAGVESQLNGKRIVKNELRMDSIFKENTKSLRGENILVKYEDYKIPVVRKTAPKEIKVADGQMSLLDDIWE